MAERTPILGYAQMAATLLINILAKAADDPKRVDVVADALKKGALGAATGAAAAGVAGAIVGGGLTTAAHLLIAKVASRSDHNEAEREALESALHNEHLAHAAADAVRHTLLASKGILDKKRLGQLADAAAEHWLELLRKDDPSIAAYDEKNLAIRLEEYLNDDPIEPHILLFQWKKFLMDGAASKKLTLDLNDLEWNALAGHVCREYPRQLYSTIKTDLEHKGAAFGGVILRMLSQISHSVQELRTQPVRDIDLAPIYRHFEEFTQTVLDKTRSVVDQLDPSSQKARVELVAFRSEMLDALAGLRKTTLDTLAGVLRLHRWTVAVLALLVLIVVVLFETSRWVRELLVRPQSEKYSFAGKWEATQVKYSVPQLGQSLPTAWGGIRIFVDQALQGDVKGHLEVDKNGQYTLDMSAENQGDVTALGNIVEINKRLQSTLQTATQDAYNEEMTFLSASSRHAINVKYSVMSGSVMPKGYTFQGWRMQFDEVDFEGVPYRYVGWLSPSLDATQDSRLPVAVIAQWTEDNQNPSATWRGSLGITPDGKYRFKASIHETGLFQAENGKWHRAPNGGVPVDGTYDAHGASTVTTADSQGTITWKRIVSDR